MSSSDGAQPCDALGGLVSTGDLFITSRGEILRACVTEPSFWRARQICVEPAKGGAHTYRPASMLVRVTTAFDLRMPKLDVSRVWRRRTSELRAKNAETLRERKQGKVMFSE